MDELTVLLKIYSYVFQILSTFIHAYICKLSETNENSYHLLF